MRPLSLTMRYCRAIGAINVLSMRYEPPTKWTRNALNMLSVCYAATLVAPIRYKLAIILLSPCNPCAIGMLCFPGYMLSICCKKPIHVISNNYLAINTLSERYQYAMDTLRTVRHVLRICYRHAIHVLS